MRVVVIVVAIAGLAGGLLGAFAYSQTLGEAGAVPQDQRVREQNLDAVGLIRVHEQGTADVNVTNASFPVTGTVDVGNLPAVQDVNVLALPSHEGRLIGLGTVQTSGEMLFPMVDISDCRRITVLAAADEEGSIVTETQEGWFTSADGSTPIQLAPPPATSGTPANIVGNATAVSHDIGVTLRFLQVKLSSSPRNPPFNVTAWIWCQP